ncbi:SPX domain-containing membrane protein [Seminavis robusta]|uniref:SPX domain-containing membrane protein n=1 Tax=Seminavis robusta TaxID=568900 RepID=A0A9N8DIH7_9STRA|nr:SPX domain-containing membrane protein [Seminavis robusta]|eukprot:Sro139_g065050.1 SPX domain-containing membrane protein (812) ;mRNA; f:40205-42821
MMHSSSIVPATRRNAGQVQLALLQSLEERRHEPWAKFYVSVDRLTPLLLQRTRYYRSARNQTERFLAALDDEVDKAVVFFFDCQGQIARELWAMSKWSAKSEPDSSLYDHAIQLLRLVTFVDLNIHIVERVLGLHDELLSANVGHLYLASKAGREARTPNDHHRLKALLRPESLKATVGIAATIYYRYIKYQAKRNNRVNLTGQSLRVVPSMSSLAGFLASDDSSEDLLTPEEGIDDEQPVEEDESEEDGDDDDDDEPADMKALVLAERAIKKPVLSSSLSSPNSVSAYSLGPTEDQLVGAVLLRIDTALTNLNKAETMMECLALPDLMGANRESFFPEREFTDEPKGLGEIIVEHQRTVGSKDPEKLKARRCSSWLNLLNSFLYMVSYYLVAPTSSAYARRLGLEESMSGAIIGCTAGSALASTVLYSWWTSHSYKHALIFSSLCCLAGNVIYAAGLPFDSLALVLIGRLLNGFGSARAINRRFIADAFSKAERTAESANFVASGAAGMSVGPGLAALMPLLMPKGSTNLWWQEENAAGWVMALLWIVYLAFLIPYFRDPPKPPATPSPPKLPNNKAGNLQSLYNGEKKPLLAKDAQGTQDHQVAGELPLWKRPAALITIFLVFLLKLVLELVLSASAPVTDFYFDWTPSTTGWFLAALGLLVLPAIWFVTWMSKKCEDRYLILYSVVGTLFGCILMMQYQPHYSQGQYMFATIVLFVFPNCMEAPSMSLLSKNIPSSLSRGIFNLGFFTTEAGFSGRVVADSVLTWCGSGGTEHLVNHTFGFLTLLNLLALVLVYFHMPVLVDPSKKFD